MKRLPFLLALSLALPLVAGCDEQLVGSDPAAGTLATETASSLPPILDRGGRPLSARLNGENEVPGPGDPDGTGSAFVTLNHGQREAHLALAVVQRDEGGDRKSTRLKSSHVKISYAVFCLKKKKGEI